MLSFIQDRKHGERLTQFIPALEVEGCRLFVVKFTSRQDDFIYTDGFALLREDGRPIDNAVLFEKAYLTYRAAYMIANPQVPWSVRMQIRHQIPRLRRTMQRNLAQLESRSLARDAQLLMAGVDVAEAVLIERERYRKVVLGYFKAMGYGWVNDYHYEDAQRLFALQAAYVDRIRTNYRASMQVAADTADTLLHRIDDQPRQWSDRKNLKDASGYLIRTYEDTENQLNLIMSQRSEDLEKAHQQYQSKLANMVARKIAVIKQ